jgi:hypothetical protein
MDSLSPYKLTVVGAFIVIVLSSALVFVLDGPTNAAPYLTFIGSVAVPVLLALFKLEQNTAVRETQHQENSDKLNELKQELDTKQ